jgi:hypothetical protein
VVVLPYVRKGNATDQVLTNLEKKERSSRCIRICVKYSPFNFNFGLFITPYWCFRFKTPLSNYKVEEGFQSITIGNKALQ